MFCVVTGISGAVWCQFEVQRHECFERGWQKVKTKRNESVTRFARVIGNRIIKKWRRNKHGFDHFCQRSPSYALPDRYLNLSHYENVISGQIRCNKKNWKDFNKTWKLRIEDFDYSNFKDWKFSDFAIKLMNNLLFDNWIVFFFVFFYLHITENNIRNV